MERSRYIISLRLYRRLHNEPLAPHIREHLHAHARKIDDDGKIVAFMLPYEKKAFERCLIAEDIGPV